jgi:NTP pyrophosphatase (non-canonical NTP hydrolase)
MLSKEAPQEAYVAWLVDGAGLPFVGDDRVKVGFTEGFCAGEAASLMDRSAKLRGVLSNWYKPVRQLCESKGWRRHEPGAAPKEGHEFPAYIALLHSEATEALEAFRDKLWSETCYAIGTGEVHKKGCSGRKHDHPKPIGVGPEFADVFIRLIDMCDMWGIDLDAEVDRVMAFGWTRPFQHGGRIL